ncbi:hypothetical protein GDO78_017678 [Eleutherodactylus coqui]|uniref:Uncharacterized protein n=1 Tax=Eleutherodactylus coqui TaxID=57060 RepID=A0A8J6B9V6_ELECQ|nr:hypothetical protein GDO78_017678 [Eleutherodactylus coqui]
MQTDERRTLAPDPRGPHPSHMLVVWSSTSGSLAAAELLWKVVWGHRGLSPLVTSCTSRSEVHPHLTPPSNTLRPRTAHYKDASRLHSNTFGNLLQHFQDLCLSSVNRNTLASIRA